MNIPKDYHAYTFAFTGETVVYESKIENERLYWRLSINEFHTDWTCHYEGLCVIASRVHPAVRFAYATPYWEGTLPVNVVFMIYDITQTPNPYDKTYVCNQPTPQDHTPQKA